MGGNPRKHKAGYGAGSGRWPARRGVGTAAVLLGAIGGFAGVSHAQCTYEATVIRYPLECAFGEVQTRVNGLNDEGWIVGTYWCPIWEYRRGFYRTVAGEFVDMGLPDGALEVTPVDINNNGQICGWAEIDQVGPRAFVFEIETDEWTFIDPVNPELGWSFANAINDDGVVAGSRTTVEDDVWPRGAFILHSDGTLMDLGIDGTSARDLNNQGAVAGERGTVTGNGEGFVWAGETLTWIGILPGSESSGLRGISDSGEVVAVRRIEDPEGEFRTVTYLWHDGAVNELPELPGHQNTFGSDINLRRQIIGSGTDPQSSGVDWEAFLWQLGEIVVLDTLVADPSIGTIETGITINENGLILAGGHDPQNTIIGFLVEPIDASPADTDGDCDTDFWDLLKVLQDWGQNISPADFDSNGTVGVRDLLMVLVHWG